MIPTSAFALEPNEYRQFMGLDSRKLIWFLAQLHLFFGAFVLGVPLFAVIIEVVGWRNGDAKFDKLAYEFTSLLSVAYATTAALGGLLAFALFTLYPTFMGYMAGLFKDVMFMYAMLFFAETILSVPLLLRLGLAARDTAVQHYCTAAVQGAGCGRRRAVRIVLFRCFRNRHAGRYADIHDRAVYPAGRDRTAAHPGCEERPRPDRYHAECFRRRHHATVQQLGRLHDEPRRRG